MAKRVIKSNVKPNQMSYIAVEAVTVMVAAVAATATTATKMATVALRMILFIPREMPKHIISLTDTHAHTKIHCAARPREH